MYGINLGEIEAPDQSQDITTTFLGYNHNQRISTGEFNDMENLCSDNYPVMSVRKPRSVAKTLYEPQGMIAKEKLAYIDLGHLYYNGQLTNVSVTEGEKTIVGMGAYILVFPDAVYYNTKKPSDSGSIETSFRVSNTSTNSAVFTMTRLDGNKYTDMEITRSDTAPSNPTNGKMWLDTSGSTHVLKTWSATTAMWVTVASTYVMIECTGIGVGLSQYDAIELKMNSDSQMKSLVGTHVVYGCGDDYIIIPGLIDRSFSKTAGWIGVYRSVPKMDYIVESQNRLWGCRFGDDGNGNTVNEIYCCALGDFKNWSKFRGISTDSWRGSVGSDGPWTGAITYDGYPLFFKEDRVHKVYISSTGAHQVIENQIRGVQPGSAKSLAIVNETLFYLSSNGVCAYTGAMPSGISDQFGDESYSDGVAGSFGNKYYLSCKDKDSNPVLFVYDTSKRLWHKEDSTDIMCFAKLGDSLYYIDKTSEQLIDANGVDGVPVGDVEWMAISQRIGLDQPQRKYISRLNWKLILPVGSWLDVYFQYDSDGVWRLQGHIEGKGDRTFMLPIRPRRCDHFYIKLVGCGDMKCFAFSKILEVGSDFE